jgi:hypothetical protein
MLVSRYDVFICYRRAGGSALAELVRRDLRGRRYRTFMDRSELGSGPFDEQLLRRIEEAQDFIIVLTPGCLDRCGAPDDWVRREAGHALRTQRNIVPLRTREFIFPEPNAVPAEIAELLRHHAVEYSDEHSEASMDRLVRMLSARPRSPWRSRLLAAWGLLLVGLGATWVVGWSRPSLTITSAPASRLRVTQWEVHAFRGDDPSADLGLLGRDRDSAQVGDKLHVIVRLSEAAYACLLALNTDGSLQLALPEDQRQPPPRTDRLELYPGSDDFQLAEGAGPQAFVVVASSRPLPAFVNWHLDPRNDVPWTSQAWAGVWQFDGERLVPDDSANPGKADGRGTEKTRGKKVHREGPESLARACRTLRERVAAETVAGLAFPVKSPLVNR